MFVVGTVYRGPRYGPEALPRGAGRRKQTPTLGKAFPPKAKHRETGSFEMILARTQQNRKAPQFSYAKENTVFLCKKEAPRGAV